MAQLLGYHPFELYNPLSDLLLLRQNAEKCSSRGYLGITPMATCLRRWHNATPYRSHARLSRTCHQKTSCKTSMGRLHNLMAWICSSCIAAPNKAPLTVFMRPLFSHPRARQVIRSGVICLVQPHNLGDRLGHLWTQGRDGQNS